MLYNMGFALRSSFRDAAGTWRYLLTALTCSWTVVILWLSYLLCSEDQTNCWSWRN